VHKPGRAAPVGQEERTAAFKHDVLLGEAGLLIELHEGLLPWSGPGIEVTGDAVPEPLIVVDCAAPPEEGDAAMVFQDDGHDFADGCPSSGGFS
jgi:hypothetical protein